MYSILCQKQGINWLVWLILYNSRYPLCLIGFKIELTGKVLFDNICWPNPTELKWHLIDNAWGGKGCKGTYIIVPASRGPSIFLDKPRRASARRVHYTILLRTGLKQHFIHYLKRLIPTDFVRLSCNVNISNTTISIFLFLSKVSVLVHYSSCNVTGFLSLSLSLSPWRLKILV